MPARVPGPIPAVREGGRRDHEGRRLAAGGKHVLQLLLKLREYRVSLL
jgi:hypothetical protein